MVEVFRSIYTRNLWGNAESRSGPGSSLAQTEHVRRGLQKLLLLRGICHLLDVPCGDANWVMKIIQVDQDLIYHGGDIVPELVEENRLKYPKFDWQVLDICTSDLPQASMILCRDCLVHLPIANIFEALANIKRSGATWLTMTTFPGIPEGNKDIITGSWRRLDFQQPPFNFPPPDDLINECREGPSGPGDKSLGSWRISRLP